MAHNRKLLLGGVSLTNARLNKNTFITAEEARDELEEILIDKYFFDGAPFKSTSLILRFGLKYDSDPSYQRIDEKDGDLPLAIELDTHDLISADREELKRLFMVATLTALIHAGKKYKRPQESIEALTALKEELSLPTEI